MLNISHNLLWNFWKYSRSRWTPPKFLDKWIQVKQKTNPAKGKNMHKQKFLGRPCYINFFFKILITCHRLRGLSSYHFLLFYTSVILLTTNLFIFIGRYNFSRYFSFELTIWPAPSKDLSSHPLGQHMSIFQEDVEIDAS